MDPIANKNYNKNQKNGGKRRIALIVDNPYRDLRGITLLAYNLVQNRAICFIVPMNLCNKEIWSLLPDYVLFPYYRTNNEALIGSLLQAGINVGILDTEGGILPDLEYYVKISGKNNDVRERITHFFLWGEKLSQYLVQNGIITKEKVFVTGCPRFDFYCKPWNQCALQLDIEKISSLKPYILYNGIFPLCNPQFQTVEEEIEMYVKNFQIQRENIEEKVEIQRNCFLQTTELVKTIAKAFPQINIVYRPHPFEKIETYDPIFSTEPNIHIIRSGTVDSWILSSSAVIGRSCSTLVEAAIASIPAFSPQWIPTDSVQMTAESVATPCDSISDLLSNLSSVFNGTFQVRSDIKEKLNSVIRDYFYRVDGYSHDRIAQLILSQKNENKLRERIDSSILGLKEISIWQKDTKFWFRFFKSILLIYYRHIHGYKIPNIKLSKWEIDGFSKWISSHKYYSEKEIANIIQLIVKTRCKENNNESGILVTSAVADEQYFFQYVGKSVVIRMK